MINLNLPLTWITPSGMIITQHYYKSKKTLIPIKFAGTSKKLVIREWTDILNKQNKLELLFLILFFRCKSFIKYS